MNEEEIEIETNDPTIKAILKRLNHLEEQVHEQEVRIDSLESTKPTPTPTPTPTPKPKPKPKSKSKSK